MERERVVWLERQVDDEMVLTEICKQLRTVQPPRGLDLKMAWVFQRGTVLVVAGNCLAAVSMLQQAQQDLAQWRELDTVVRISYEGDDWFKVQFRLTPDTDPAKFLGSSQGGSTCGCERRDLNFILPGIEHVVSEWYNHMQRSMKGYWLEF
jgi:hypothetical protein